VRRGSDPKSIAEMHTFSGRTIDMPSMFIGTRSDWGIYQTRAPPTYSVAYITSTSTSASVSHLHCAISAADGMNGATRAIFE
jgi:hypothetical protein